MLPYLPFKIKIVMEGHPGEKQFYNSGPQKESGLEKAEANIHPQKWASTVLLDQLINIPCFLHHHHHHVKKWCPFSGEMEQGRGGLMTLGMPTGDTCWRNRPQNMTGCLLSKVVLSESIPLPSSPNGFKQVSEKTTRSWERMKGPKYRTTQYRNIWKQHIHLLSLAKDPEVKTLLYDYHFHLFKY